MKYTLEIDGEFFGDVSKNFLLITVTNAIHSENINKIVIEKIGD